MSRPPRKLIVVLDENLASQQLCDAMKATAAANDAVVEMLSTYFPRGTKDHDWLPEAGRRGWVVITVDVHIKHRPAEREILTNAGVIAFIVRGNGMNGDKLRDALVAAVPAICRRARQLRPPIICHVHRDGRVEVIRGERKGGVKRA